MKSPKSPLQSNTRSVCDPVFAKSFWAEKLGYTGKTYAKVKAAKITPTASNASIIRTAPRLFNIKQALPT
jgi:hypothetical protein